MKANARRNTSSLSVATGLQKIKIVMVLTEITAVGHVMTAYSDNAYIHRPKQNSITAHLE